MTQSMDFPNFDEMVDGGSDGSWIGVSTCVGDELVIVLDWLTTGIYEVNYYSVYAMFNDSELTEGSCNIFVCVPIDGAYLDPLSHGEGGTTASIKSLICEIKPGRYLGWMTMIASP